PPAIGATTLADEILGHAGYDEYNAADWYGDWNDSFVPEGDSGTTGTTLQHESIQEALPATACSMDSHLARNFGTSNRLDPPEEIPFKGRKTILGCLALAKGLNTSMLAVTGHDLTWLNPGRASIFRGEPLPEYLTPPNLNVADEESLQFKMCYMLGYEAKLRVHIEAAECWARGLSIDEFQELQENMIQVKAKTWFGSITAMDWLCGNWSLLSGVMDFLVALDEPRPQQPSARTGEHNRLVPRHRLRTKMTLGRTTGEYKWRQKQCDKLATAIKFSSRSWLAESLETEYQTLVQISQDFASSHSVLATAHGVLQKVPTQELHFTVSQDLVLVGLVSYAIAVASHSLDADEFRRKYRRTESHSMNANPTMMQMQKTRSLAERTEDSKPSGARADAGAARSDPKTKGELLMELKSQHKNTIRLVAALLHDRDLRLQLRQIQYGASPLHREYVNFLSNQKQGQESSLLWAAERATGHGWFRCVLDTLALIHDHDALLACGVTALGPELVLPDISILETQEWFQDEKETRLYIARLSLVSFDLSFEYLDLIHNAKETLQDFWFYLLELVSKRAWGQIQHAVLCPQMLAAALSADSLAADASMQSMKKTWAAVLRAEEVQLHAAGRITPAARASLGLIMGDLAFNRLSFARECAVVCRMSNWRADYKDVQDLARSLYKKPLNTKHDLEDCFGHLASVHQLTTKASPFNKRSCQTQRWQFLMWTRFFYATSLPSIANSNPEYHWPQLETSLREHASVRKKTPEQQKACYGKAFKVSEKLDEAVRRDGFIKCKLGSTKKAGIISNQKASAATAWVVANQHNDFADAALAWTGCFFAAGCLYQNRSSNEVVLCLGFREYGALAVQLKEIKVEDKEYFVIQSNPSPTEACLLPSWLFNQTMTEQSEWQFVPTALQHPYALPALVRDEYGVAILRTGPNQGLVGSALEQGVLLTKKNYVLMHQVYGFGSLPQKGHGSGKAGNLVKLDYVKAAVAHFFPNWSAERRHDLCEQLMAKKLPHLRAACPSEVLEVFNALSPEDQQTFGAVKFLQRDQTAIKSRSKEPEPRSLSAKVHFTPADLKDLVPDIAGSYINRHPILKRYQAFYPVNSAVLSMGKEPKVFSKSRTATWEGPERNLSEAAALWEVVEWAWDMHAQHQPIHADIKVLLG
ncbi:unnamed protein product, partial [Symbiodinium microadriaticum]